MRIAFLALALVLAAGLSFAAAPQPTPKAGKPAGDAPAASPTPTEKPKDPGKNECTGTTKDGASYRATAVGYQACLLEITNSVKAKHCKDGVRYVDFTFHRGGQRPQPQTVVCH